MKKSVIGITTGDIRGVGLEVTMKALHSFVNSQSTFVIWRSPQRVQKCWLPLPKKLCLTVNNLEEALQEANAIQSRYRFIELLSQDSPATWVEQAARLCLDKRLAGMVTGPVSKKTFIDANLNSLGHTPLLKRICRAKQAYMGFLGSKFNVILLTGHLPLNRVTQSLSKTALQAAFSAITDWQKDLPLSLCRKPIGVLGLNPHCGESGLIGTFEQNILGPLLEEYSDLRGPLVPDAAFGQENWKTYSFYLALYHDQGLIPFKMIHGHSGGAHVTVGLPIVRTSVDHGTASDLFGKGLARPESMRDAIQWCETLIRRKG